MPAARIKSTSGELLVRRVGTAAFTRLSQDDGGLAGASGGETQGVRRKPSSGDFALFQLLPYKQAGIQIAIDENEVTHALFWFATGERFDVRWQPHGSTAGDPQFDFTGTAAVSLNAAEGGVRTFVVSIPADGNWVESVVA